MCVVGRKTYDNVDKGKAEKAGMETPNEVERKQTKDFDTKAYEY